jgi:hypothetical protein
MAQMSKIIHSRDEWKRKTIECNYQLREYRKTQKRHLQKIAELKQANRRVKQLFDEKKTVITG